jgi:hypothetical protein
MFTPARSSDLPLLDTLSPSVAPFFLAISPALAAKNRGKNNTATNMTTHLDGFFVFIYNA